MRTFLAAALLAAAGLPPALAADCTATDPVGCPPPPPPPVRDLARISPCVTTDLQEGVLVTGDAEVPFATSVTIWCEGNTSLGYVSEPATTKPGQANAVVAFHLGVVGVSNVRHVLSTHVSWTYSDGTSGSACVC